jgi:hypothetical protein
VLGSGTGLTSLTTSTVTEEALAVCQTSGAPPPMKKVPMLK